MRTDSNSVLSLSSGVPPKKAPFVQAPSKKGDAFSDDFNKAKETLNTSKASTASASSAESSPSSDHVLPVTKYLISIVCLSVISSKVWLTLQGHQILIKVRLL